MELQKLREETFDADNEEPMDAPPLSPLHGLDLEIRRSSLPSKLFVDDDEDDDTVVIRQPPPVPMHAQTSVVNLTTGGSKAIVFGAMVKK